MKSEYVKTHQAFLRNQAAQPNQTTEVPSAYDTFSIVPGSAQELFDQLQKTPELSWIPFRREFRGEVLNFDNDKKWLVNYPDRYYIRFSSQPDYIVLTSISVKTNEVYSFRFRLAELDEGVFIYLTPKEINSNELMQDFIQSLRDIDAIDDLVHSDRLERGYLSIAELCRYIQEIINKSPFNFDAVDKELSEEAEVRRHLFKYSNSHQQMSTLSDDFLIEKKQKMIESIESHPSFFKDFALLDACENLKGKPKGTYLIRPSGEDVDTYTLSFVGTEDEINHIRFGLEKGQISCNGSVYSELQSYPVFLVELPQQSSDLNQKKMVLEKNIERLQYLFHNESCRGFLDTLLRCRVITYAFRSPIFN